MTLVPEELRQAYYINKMLIQHLDNHIEQGLELAIYVFKWPVKYIRVIEYKDRPFRQLVLDSPGLLSILLEVELKPNPLDPMAVVTYIGGDIAEFMIYNMIKEVKPDEI